MKQITITDNEFDVLTDIFSSIAELDMDEILTDDALAFVFEVEQKF